MSICEIQIKICNTAVSSGNSPYTIVPVEVNDELISLTGRDSLYGFKQGLAFFIWEDYTLEDYKDFIKNSKEYLQISDGLKKQFLIERLNKTIEKDDLIRWQNNQMYLAIGIAINELRSSNVSYKIVDDVKVFDQLVKVKNALLSTIIFFN